QGGQRFPGISAKLVRMCEITANLWRCKNIFENFCQGERCGGNGRGSFPSPPNIFTTGDTGEHRESRFPPCFPCTSVSSVVKILTQTLFQSSSRGSSGLSLASSRSSSLVFSSRGIGTVIFTSTISSPRTP